MDDNTEKKKVKGTKKCVIKRRLMFESCIDCLLNNKIVLKSQQRFKSDHHNVYTEQINNIALSSNGGKRLQTFDKITIYPYGINALLNLINNQPDLDQIYLYVKDPYEAKYQF